MARNFDDMFNEALYGKRRWRDNTLMDNWIYECLFDYSEEDIDRSSIPNPRRWINKDREAGHDRLFQDYFADEPIGSVKLEKEACHHSKNEIQILAYGVAADAVDYYVRIGERTTFKFLEKFVEGVISVFEDEYLRKSNSNDVRHLLQMVEGCGFPGMLDHSPVFVDILNDRAPEVNYTINGNNYTMGYYLAYGIYSEWATFVKSISKPQGEKRKLFAQY
ncbi:uncharacterized protein LOC107633497 [Arachis ipaensis]|uniref:uncharacterized protein LOC107633497 n=1 Tax=Arachis ipaensis TaxID=130454 RepID=UPI0007AFC787|nr:uncharacterized protein LOC107633497 [Arachis ipaensis]